MTRELAILDDGMALAQYGPMRLTIQAWAAGGPSTELARKAGEFSFSLLPRLAPGRELFRRDLHPFDTIKPDFAEPMFNLMVSAVRQTGLPELGPMAAVAGTVSQTVAEFLKEAGADKAIVENGGDLAVWLKPGQAVKVGVRLGVDNPLPSYKMVLSGDLKPFWGVASSGLGGRSLSQGLADTALCVAASGPLADAAATAVANHCRVDSPAVKMAAAETLDPDTDIRGLMVTESVGELTEAEVDAALASALRYAQKLTDQGMILGAAVSLRGRLAVTPGFDQKAAPLDPI
ncbi:hypothetical protein LJB86_00325 [Deltaproteobacteria bacterium OttesenSCG-928-M10]|nr:hypothetical protein [Deltaproteobacteria bacterium OttesenSCG-928-M10]